MRHYSNIIEIVLNSMQSHTGRSISFHTFIPEAKTAISSKKDTFPVGCAVRNRSSSLSRNSLPLDNSTTAQVLVLSEDFASIVPSLYMHHLRQTARSCFLPPSTQLLQYLELNSKKPELMNTYPRNDLTVAYLNRRLQMKLRRKSEMEIKTLKT